jgi:hypothetical protein
MKTRFHIEISQLALEKYFSQNVIEKIIKANTRQDRIKFQFGHDYIHFDSSAFSEGFDYISQQTELIYESLLKGDFELAWCSLGRILHSWQDFYAHSNYVRIWLQKTPNPEPKKINYKDQEIIGSPNLRSGKNYGLFEFLALTPVISILVKPLMPSDSHAKMNLDSPNSSPAFDYAYYAAKSRTEDVIEQIINEINHLNLSEEMLNTFLGK